MVLVTSYLCNFFPLLDSFFGDFPLCLRRFLNTRKCPFFGEGYRQSCNVQRITDSMHSARFILRILHKKICWNASSIFLFLNFYVILFSLSINNVVRTFEIFMVKDVFY